MGLLIHVYYFALGQQLLCENKISDNRDLDFIQIQRSHMQDISSCSFRLKHYKHLEFQVYAFSFIYPKNKNKFYSLKLSHVQPPTCYNSRIQGAHCS